MSRRDWEGLVELMPLFRRPVASAPAHLALRERAALVAAAVFGSSMAESLGLCSSAVNLGALAIVSRCSPETWLIRPSAAEVVHGTDLHSIPSAPPRLLRGPGIVEVRRPETGERLFGDWASLGFYAIDGTTYLLGLSYPDGYAVARWSPRWTGEDLAPQLPGSDIGSPLISDLGAHQEFAVQAARYLVVLGLLVEGRAGSSPRRARPQDAVEARLPGRTPAATAPRGADAGPSGYLGRCPRIRRQASHRLFPESAVRLGWLADEIDLRPGLCGAPLVRAALVRHQEGGVPMQHHMTDEELAIYGAGADDSITSRIARELIALRAALSPIEDHGVDIDISRLTTSGLLIALRTEEQLIERETNLVVRRARELRAWSLESELARRNARTTREVDPTCQNCNDTHVMSLGEREVPCTHCPVPCGLCRQSPQGPYCASTPCACSCHAEGQ